MTDLRDTTLGSKAEVQIQVPMGLWSPMLLKNILSYIRSRVLALETFSCHHQTHLILLATCFSTDASPSSRRLTRLRRGT